MERRFPSTVAFYAGRQLGDVRYFGYLDYLNARLVRLQKRRYQKHPLCDATFLKRMIETGGSVALETGKALTACSSGQSLPAAAVKIEDKSTMTPCYP